MFGQDASSSSDGNSGASLGGNASSSSEANSFARFAISSARLEGNILGLGAALPGSFLLFGEDGPSSDAPFGASQGGNDASSDVNWLDWFDTGAVCLECGDIFGLGLKVFILFGGGASSLDANSWGLLGGDASSSDHPCDNGATSSSSWGTTLKKEEPNEAIESSGRGNSVAGGS